MPGENYYLVTSLPTLGDLGSMPPIGLGELVERVGAFPGPSALIEAIVTGDDLLQRQGFLAGEIKSVQPAVLTAGQVRNEEPLPEPLAAGPADAQPLAAIDAVWEAYFRWAQSVARRQGSAFLNAWVGHEVALRNALAAERAKALGLAVEPYLVVPELGRTDANLDALLAEWSAAPDPLAGLRVLDQGRWGWLTDNDAWFSFDDDEVAVYAARLVLLHRWHRLGEARQPASPQPARPAASSPR